MSQAQETDSDTGTDAQIWTTGRLLRWMQEYFVAKQVDSPRVIATMLLEHVLGCDRTRLYMEIDRPASDDELATLRKLVARAAQGEPVHFLVGEAMFLGRSFAVARCTLIPQPCTGLLVEKVLDWKRKTIVQQPMPIADVGTGTGCIGVSLLAALPDAKLIATDVTDEVLKLARQNAVKFGVEDRVEFVRGEGLSPVRAAVESSGGFDCVVSNPPYIPDHEWDDQVEAGVKSYVAATALRGGADGLDVVRPLIAGGHEVLRPGGLLVVEIADCQGDSVIALAEQAGMYRDITVEKDHDGKWRVFSAVRA